MPSISQRSNMMESSCVAYVPHLVVVLEGGTDVRVQHHEFHLHVVRPGHRRQESVMSLCTHMQPAMARYNQSGDMYRGTPHRCR